MTLASPAASKETKYEHKCHDSQRGKRWRVGRQRDRGDVDALRAVAFNLFQFADIQTLMEVEKHCAEKLLIIG